MSDIPLVQHPSQLFVGGKWIDPSSSSRIDVIDSATEECFLRVVDARAEDVDRAVEAAREAFDRGPWPRLSPTQRATHLRAIARELNRRADAHARLWTREAGVVFSASKARMPGLSETYEYYADLAQTYPFQQRHVPKNGGEVALVVREPVGVVAAIVGWNGAPGLITTKVAPALLARLHGRRQGVARSAWSGLHHCRGVRGCRTAAGGSQHRHRGTRGVGAPGAPSRHRQGDLHRIYRDGAPDRRDLRRARGALHARTRRQVARGRARRLRRRSAAQSIASRATFQTGQVCYSLTRIIVSRHRHDALVAALSDHFRSVVVGDPFDPQVQMGPLANKAQYDRVTGYIAKGLAEGATLATGGRRPPHLDRGYFVEPTVFGNVANTSTIGREEIFGPVLCVIPADDEEQAIEIANDTIYGLNAAVFTNDADRAYAVARRLRCGTVGHNAVRREHRLPFGGFKQSGLGREGGSEGVAPYLETKVVILDAVPARSV